MVSFAEWAAAVVGAGLVAGIVVLAGAAAGVWLLVRKVRRRAETLYRVVESHGLQVGRTAFAGRGRPARPTRIDLRQYMSNSPEAR